MTRLQNIWDTQVQPLIDQIESIVYIQNDEFDNYRNSASKFKRSEKFQNLVDRAWQAKEDVKRFYDRNLYYFTRETTNRKDDWDADDNTYNVLAETFIPNLQNIIDELLKEPESINLFLKNATKRISNFYLDNLKKENEFKDINFKINDLSKKYVAKEYVEIYNDEIEKYGNNSKVWLGISAAYFIIFIIVLLFSSVIQLNTDNFFAHWLYNYYSFVKLTPIQNDIERYAIRAVFTSLGIYGLFFVVKNYRVNKNLEYVLSQKKTSLESYNKFIGSIDDKVIKDKVAEAVANQIYEVYDTGFVPYKKGGNEDTNINFPFANVNDILKNSGK